ncbi:MAG: hypothetical protein M3Q29_11760 [Chloroflexota bacterium]|nr:hypothetical protein [Chloroflexota bacterium]
MYNLARIRYVTRHYNDLQGLTMVPLALFFLTWAGYDAGWISPPPWLSNEWLLVGASATVVGTLGYTISKLYERAYGRIEAAPHHIPQSHKREFWIWWSAYMVAFAFLPAVYPQVSRLGLLISIIIFMEWRSRREARHWLILALWLAALSLVPILDGVRGPIYPSATVRDIAIKLVTAAGFLVISTIDHLTLVRTLGPIRREEESRA